MFNDSYSVAGDYVCGLCKEISGNAIKITIISLWTLISMGFALKSTINMIRSTVMINCF